MLDVQVAEVVLQSRVITQHVWADRERHLGSLADDT